jgi:diadenylate cyclase
MDGAIVLSQDVHLILKANVQLIPDPSIATDETGTRQRTAERMARQTGFPVISVSEDRGTATVYTPDRRYDLRPATALLAHANQSIQSLERFRLKLDEAADSLSRAEVADAATYTDVLLPMQRSALVDRLGADLDSFLVQLGQEGGLIRVQLTDLLHGVHEILDLVFQDYAPRRVRTSGHMKRLDGVPTEGLYDATLVASAVGFGPLDAPVQPRGLRALARVPRLPDSVKDAIITHFGDYQKRMHASVSDFDQVEGVGRARAQLIRHYLDQMLDVSSVWNPLTDPS